MNDTETYTVELTESELYTVANALFDARDHHREHDRHATARELMKLRARLIDQQP